MVSKFTRGFRLPFEVAFRMLSELFRIMVEANGSFNDCEGWKSILCTTVMVSIFCTTVMVSILTQWFRLPFEAAFRMLSELFRIMVEANCSFNDCEGWKHKR